MGVKTLEELTERHNAIVDEAQGLIKATEGKGIDEETGEKLRTLDEEFKGLNAEMAKQTDLGDISDRFGAAKHVKVPEGDAGGAGDDDQGGARGNGSGNPNIYGFNPEAAKAILDSMKTPGERFVDSDAYRGWLSAYPSGGPSMQVETFSQPVDVAVIRDLLGLKDATTKLRGVLDPGKFRTLITSSDASAGELVLSLRRGLLEPGLVRPLTIRDLVTVIPVTTDTIEYVRELSRVQNAAIVADATALTGTSGLKPEGGLTFEKKTDVVKTIAEWVPLTKRILSDASQLRAYVDQYLTYDIALELEDQITGGDGTGENFTGILNTPLVNTQTGGDTMLHDLRMAKRKVRVNGRTNANGIVINPEDIEAIDLLRDESGGANTGQFLGQDPFNYTGNPRVWGLPLVESEAVDPGTAIVGDFNRAILFDRESTNISVGTAGDDFIRNIVRVLAEMRAGFGVIRPTAFTIVTF